MFAWLFKKISRNPWKHADGHYIVHFRKELDEVAGLLSRNSRDIVHTRFNRYRACAEMYTDAGEVIALVRAHSKQGQGEDAIHITCCLPDQSKKFFELLKPFKVVFHEFSC